MRSFMVKESSLASSLELLGGGSLGHICEGTEVPGEPTLEVVAGGVDCWDPDGVADARVLDEWEYTQGVSLRTQ
jgi:hypothetical protein